MNRMRFGIFLAPHHPIGEHPTLQIRRDLELVAHLDALGYDEFWCGEHHSGGWETIASPEMFLAAAGEKTHRIMLGTGVISLPYHHPFNVAQRIVQLDHMTRGRAMLGVGPGALPSDAHTLGIAPAVQRDRMDEALGIIIRLLREEKPFSYKSDWFELHDAQLQIRPLQEELPIVAASTISPAGMKAAGKYGVGVISIASQTEAGLAALPTQWGFGQTYAAEYGQVLDRSKWRINANFHIAPTREQAIQEVAEGLLRWHNEYNVEIPGGFGTLIGFAHDWPPREAQLRSFEMFARYVIPRAQGLIEPLKRSADYVAGHKHELMEAAGQAVLGAIRAHNATHARQ
jgi:limonene 1,2-monooxygenase